MHVDYREYASSHYSGLWTAPALAMISSAMVRAYCHKGEKLLFKVIDTLHILVNCIANDSTTVVKLSDTLQTYAPEKECTSNVHVSHQVV